MATREQRFRQAAWTYFGYGMLYMAGAIYLATQGVGARGTPAAPGVIWFVLGTLFIIVFPWLIARGTRGSGYVWFTRVLTLLVAFRAFGVGRVMIAPSIPSVPLPGGGDLPMRVGAGIFFLINLATAAMLARAAWSRRSEEG
jgi:hypothetical protein